MLQHCEEYPGKMQLEAFLEDTFEDYDAEETIEYKQWIHTNRHTLETCQKNFENFMDTFI